MFSYMGIAILKDASRVEVLRLGKPADSFTKTEEGYPRTPTGQEVDKEHAVRIADEVLDRNNYLYGDFGDLPEPRVGFRFWRGKESIDILISSEGSPHQDVWAFVRNDRGEDVYGLGYGCLSDSTLDKLVEEALKNCHPSPHP